MAWKEKDWMCEERELIPGWPGYVIKGTQAQSVKWEDPPDDLGFGGDEYDIVDHNDA